MSGNDTWLLVIAAVLVVVAGLFSAAEAALASVSRVRAEELAAEGKGGSRRLLEIAEDPPRYLNTALFLRMLCEITAVVLVTEVLLGIFTDNRLGCAGGGRADARRAVRRDRRGSAHGGPPACAAGGAAQLGPRGGLHQGARPAARSC